MNHTVNLKLESNNNCLKTRRRKTTELSICHTVLPVVFKLFNPLTTASRAVRLKPGLFQDRETRKARVVQLKSGLFQDHEPRLSLTSAAQLWLFAARGLERILASDAQRFSLLMVLKQAWLQPHNAARRS